MTAVSPAVVACSLAFGLAWVSVPGRSRSRWRRRGVVPTPPSARTTRAVAAAGVLAGASWTFVGAGVGLAVVAVTGGVAGALVLRLLRGGQLRRLRRRRAQAVIEVCDGLAAELRAGLPALRAIERSLAVWPEWEAVSTVARLGGNVPATLRLAAAEPGAEALVALAAAWEVAEHSGAALADVVTRLAVGLRSDEDARAEVVAALGPPRATAKMLAALPLFGLGLGVSMGAQPVDFLLRTEVGVVCLGTGVLLALLGLWWVERIADAVEV